MHKAILRKILRLIITYISFRRPIKEKIILLWKELANKIFKDIYIKFHYRPFLFHSPSFILI